MGLFADRSPAKRPSDQCSSISPKIKRLCIERIHQFSRLHGVQGLQISARPREGEEGVAVINSKAGEKRAVAAVNMRSKYSKLMPLLNDNANAKLNHVPDNLARLTNLTPSFKHTEVNSVHQLQRHSGPTAPQNTKRSCEGVTRVGGIKNSKAVEEGAVSSVCKKYEYKKLVLHDDTRGFEQEKAVNHGKKLEVFEQEKTVNHGKERMCKAAESSCGCKSQMYEVTNGSKSKNLLVRRLTTEASRWNCAKEKPSILSEAENKLFDHKGNKKSILVRKGSNDLSGVAFNHAQIIVSKRKVKETLNLFEDVYAKLSCKEKANAHTPMMAAMQLKEWKKWINTEQFIGHVPGVEVGDKFQFRAELVVIGLHHQFQGGIDYVKKEGKLFATSIVVSGRYANDAESPEVLIYSGQGGNPTVVHERKPKDQKLERGNLAMKNSMDAGWPIRVIRRIHGGCTLQNSGITGRTSGKMAFIYDGLYILTKCRQERGQYGKLVFKFHLNRMPGQPKLNWNMLRSSKKVKVLKVSRVVKDISQGKEKMAIRAINEVDDEKPPLFNYITDMIYPEGFNQSMPVGCDCMNGCLDSEICPCIVKNGGKVPYKNNIAINKRKPLVYECGPSCKCSSSCKNRVSQHGIGYQLEVFKSRTGEWGVRSRSFISSGSFVCEYVGELCQDSLTEQIISRAEYSFKIEKDIDDNFPQGQAFEGRHCTIDAAYSGNVARFIKHSSSPNLCAQYVLYDHDDTRMPHVVFFAARNICPSQELTYNYKCKSDLVCHGNYNAAGKCIEEEMSYYYYSL